MVISGSGNVAIYANEKATELGAKVVAMSDSNGYIYDPNGINLDVVKQIKEVERGRIKEYADRVPGSEYHRGLQGHLDRPVRHRPALRHPERAGRRGRQGPDRTTAASPWREGANMPSTLEATELLPAKRRALRARPRRPTPAAWPPPALEMSQNSHAPVPGPLRKWTRSSRASW